MIAGPSPADVPLPNPSYTSYMERGFVASASIVINAPVDVVWNAFVDPTVIRRYMFGAYVLSAWKKGGPIVWKGEWQGTPYEDKGVILALEPGRLLQYSHYSPLSGLPDAPEHYHQVTVELSARDNRTVVSLVQDNNRTEEERAHSETNWALMLTTLKTLLEQEDYADTTPPSPRGHVQNQ